MVVLLFVIGPVMLAGDGGWPGGRPFIAELGSSLGIAALGVLALLMLLPSRLPIFQGLGADVSVRLHRRLGTSFAALLAAHIAVVVAAAPPRVHLFAFVGQPWRAQAAILSTLALGALAGTSLLRRRLGLSYAAWRFLHGALAVSALVLATAHTFGWHRYLMHGAGLIALVLLAALPIAGVWRLRVYRHRSLQRAPYVVESVTAERGGAATVQLRADGHKGTAFRPGQFAWIKLGGRSLGVHEHPFSYSSSAVCPERPTFTIRAYDGFSATAAQLTPGTSVLVDGPHGAFNPSVTSPGMLLIASGIGITPIMSILRTAADRRDGRHFVVVYGSRDEESITFREELDALAARLWLDVIHTLSRPAPEWRGARGRIDAAVLAAALPPRPHRFDFFICGSGPAVGSALAALTVLGIPPERVHAERFIEV